MGVITYIGDGKLYKGKIVFVNTTNSLDFMDM